MDARKARKWTVFLLCSLVMQAPHSARAVSTDGEGIDTQFIFGFTSGADVGDLGDKEIEHQTIAQFGKRDGSYAALRDELRYETSPIENFRFEFGPVLSFYDITGVIGLDDRRQGSFDGLVAEFRYKLLDRRRAPFALTLGAEPRWGRFDETSGAPADRYSSEFLLAADTELSKGLIFAALNLVYEPEAVRSRRTGEWQQNATIGVFAAVTTRIRPELFVGMEARYLRSYDGFGFNSLTGEALFAGPTMYLHLSKTLAISGAFGIQAAGHAVNVPGFLDLTNFTRYQATFRLEYNF